MHFWIDKRSQQCGFGRSRVAASLSHAGGGLSYAHPPRRSKSTTCSNQPPVHRSLPQTPYDPHLPGTSRQSQYGNNNSLQGQHHLLQQHSSGGSSTNNNNNAGMSSSHFSTTGTSTANNNNNASGTASSAAVLTGSGTIIPLVARGSHHHPHGTRHQPRAQQQLMQQHQQQQHLQQQHQQQQQQQQHYSYHHPQFGNMAVPISHHQQQQPHSSNVYADDGYSAYHSSNSHQQHSSSYQSSVNSNTRSASAYATPRRHNSSSNMRHSPIVSSAATSTAAAGAAASATAAAYAASGVPATTHSNQLQQQHQALLQHADSQLLPSHLKCGMCASLVLASVFVAGTKFYFDHQGTGLEVLIFCAFSATFFLAACLVSLCRIPKGLLSSSSRSRGQAGSCHNRTPHSGAGAGVGSGMVPSAGCLLEMSEVRYLEEQQATTGDATLATAGPPPYHIAILLPEQTTAGLGKQQPLDESPPPSYDKILV
ncbi:hypothetical protein KR018_003464 [Drosophila ironensis]|nr:hypothetical protein KR018_003464 [Drosophila ironensis]